ncbi:phage holin family protein [Fusobacterium ulcerans]|uniref:phage holin family protein n=1 Tax=Fusobacterium ulcerans TaxID=861 RepID=UPI0027BAAB8B|nr:phage holin family protein [Fusobacterium ulcerans]
MNFRVDYKELISMVMEISKIFVEVIKVLLDKSVIVLGMLFSAIFFITGGKDRLIYCLLAVMAIDYVTGIIKSVIKGNLNSKVGFKGFLKKVFTLLIVALADQIDQLLEIRGLKYNCRYIVICFYTANEGLSILENAVNAGLKVPIQLKNILEQCKEKEIKKEKS